MYSVFHTVSESQKKKKWPKLEVFFPFLFFFFDAKPSHAPKFDILLYSDSVLRPKGS